MRLTWAVATALALSLAATMAAPDPIPTPPDYQVSEGIWIKEDGHPASSWGHYNRTNPLNLTSSASKLDVAYVLRSTNWDLRPNISLIFFRNSDTRTRFLDNGTLLSVVLEHGCGASVDNETADHATPFLVHNVSMDHPEFHLGHAYHIVLMTFDPRNHAGLYQIRVNVSGHSGGSSWDSPNGNPCVPWTFFRSSSGADCSITPFPADEDRLRASMRVNITASGLPHAGFPSNGEYEIFIDGDSVFKGPYYGTGFYRNGSQISRRLPPGPHNLTISCGEVEVSTPFVTHQWETSLGVSPSRTIPAGRPVNITGTGFPRSESYTVYLGAYQPNATPIAAGAISEYGNFSTQFSFPGDTPLGVHELTAVSTQVSGPPLSSASVHLDPWAVNLTVQPQVFRQGCWLDINGTEYPGEAWIEIYLDGETIYTCRADENGTFYHRVYTLTGAFHPGEHVISANATEYGGPPSGRVLLLVEQFNTSLTVNLNTPYPGTTIEVHGNGFPAHEAVVVELPGAVLGEFVTNSGGVLHGEITIPKDYPLGEHQLSARAPRYGGPPECSMTLKLSPWPAEIELGHTAPHPGGWVSLSATGLPPSAEYRFSLDGTLLRSGNTSQTGTLQIAPNLPANLNAGDHVVEVLIPGYSGPPSRAFALEIVPWDPLLAFSPETPRPGEALLMEGEGFPRDRSYDIYLDGSLLGSGVTSALGKIFTYIFLRRNVTLGPHTIDLHVHSPQLPNLSETVDVLQWDIAIRVSPKHGCAGTHIVVSADGCPPGADLSLAWDGLTLLNGTSTLAGTLESGLAPPDPPDNAYHEITLIVDQPYPGPPRAAVYFWWGCSPPQIGIRPCDSDGSGRSVFFSDEVPYIRGDGLPPLVQGNLHLLEGGAPPQPVATLVPTLTDDQGMFLVPILRSNLAGNYSLWLDMNANSIDDGNDVYLSPAFLVRPRPSVGITSLEATKVLAKQGEEILVRSVLENFGVLPEEIAVRFFHGSTEITTLSLTITPGSSEPLEITWDTSSSPVGQRSLKGEIDSLSGEIDDSDNSIEGPQVSLEPPPNIALRSLDPDRRTVKEGEVVTVYARIENMAPVRQRVVLELLWNDQLVTTATINVAGSSGIVSAMHWNTTGYGPGEGSIRARTLPIPFEIHQINNDIAAGSVTVLPRNSAPIADAGGPYLSLAGKPMVLDGSASRDDDGTIESFLWESAGQQAGNATKATLTLTTVGKHSVTLTVTDDSGATDDAVAIIEIVDPGEFEVWASDPDGNEQNEFLSSEPIHATLDCPREIGLGLFITIAGSAAEGFDLDRWSEARYHSVLSGKRTLKIWPSSLPGTYDIVLDLDDDGIYDPAFDSIHSTIHVVGQRALMGMILLLWLLQIEAKRGRRGTG